MADVIRCRQCDSPMQQRAIDAVSGEDGVLKVSLANFPVLECERGHRRFIADDFPVRLLEEIAVREKGVLPSGQKKGFLFGKYHCGKCGGLLAVENQPRLFEFHVGLTDAPRFRVALTMPVYKCPSCGQEQLRDQGEIEGLAPSALAHAFQVAGLKPQ